MPSLTKLSKKAIVHNLKISTFCTKQLTFPVETLITLLNSIVPDTPTGKTQQSLISLISTLEHVHDLTAKLTTLLENAHFHISTARPTPEPTSTTTSAPSPTTPTPTP